MAKGEAQRTKKEIQTYARRTTKKGAIEKVMGLLLTLYYEGAEKGLMSRE